jgi:serine/threonine kinase 16
MTADGTYALKKVLVQSDQHLELVQQEIRASSQFSHPNLLPLLEHAIVAVKVGCIVGIMYLILHSTSL